MQWLHTMFQVFMNGQWRTWCGHVWPKTLIQDRPLDFQPWLPRTWPLTMIFIMKQPSTDANALLRWCYRGLMINLEMTLLFDSICWHFKVVFPVKEMELGAIIAHLRSLSTLHPVLNAVALFATNLVLNIWIYSLLRLVRIKLVYMDCREFYS